MQQHSNLQRECNVLGWTREHREIQSYEQDALFKPLQSWVKKTTGEVEVVRLVAPPCESVVRRKIVFNPRNTNEKEGIAEEIKRLKSLDHRHVINVVGTYQAANEYGILMCPIGDQDLEAFFTQLDNGDEQRHQHRIWLHGWLSCLASAVCYIHDHGLLHKEIAPKNIIHRGSEVYFTDFGLTTSTVSDARTTTAYAAPEIERIERQHTRSSDLFSLGCVYLEILIAIDGRSVKEFRIRCWESVGYREAGFFRYYSALPKIKKLFSYRCFDDQNFCDSWGRTILPMLDPDERARPCADEVLRRLKTEDLLPSASVRFCSCQSGGATNSSKSPDLADTRQLPEWLPTHLARFGEIPVQILFFTVRNDTAANFQVDLVQPARCQPWCALEITPSFEHKSHKFQVGDSVWIRLAGEPDALAEIAEARAVGDGTSRILIRVFWYYLREEVFYKMRCSYQKRFAASYKYVKSNHTQVILWDTIQRKITEAERRLILPRKVLDRSRKPYRIYHASAPEVSWLRVVLDGSRSQSSTPEEV